MQFGDPGLEVARLINEFLQIDLEVEVILFLGEVYYIGMILLKAKRVYVGVCQLT